MDYIFEGDVVELKVRQSSSAKTLWINIRNLT